MSEGQTFLTPVGRLVRGSLFEPRKTDYQGNPLVVKHGPNAGQPRVEYFFAIAIPKTEAGFNELYAQMVATAKAAFPQHFDAAGNPTPTLNLKLTDGDSQIPDSQGNIPSQKEGFAGHWVVRFSGGFAPQVYDNTPQLNQITDPNMVKRGYWVQVSGNMKANGQGNSANPGIYMNHSMVRLVGYGEEIKSGPDASQVFQQSAALPAGASATPIAPATGLAQPGAPSMPTPGTPAPNPSAAPNVPTYTPPVTGAPQPGVPAAGVPAATPAPVASVSPSSPAPAPAPQVAPATDILEPKYNVQGNIYTKTQLLGFGWNEGQINALTPVG